MARLPGNVVQGLAYSAPTGAQRPYIINHVLGGGTQTYYGKVGKLRYYGRPL